MNCAIISLVGTGSSLIATEARSLFSHVDLFDIRKIQLHASTGHLKVLYEGKELPHYDCVYIRGSYRYALLKRGLARAFQHQSYVPFTPKAVTLGHDKLLTLLELQKSGVSIPKTYFAGTTTIAKKILDEVNYPIIMKIPAGTQGKGVMFADSASSARSMLDTLEVFKQPYIIQEYIETGATDVRAIVAGDDVIACMRRRAAKGELRANIHQGGVGEAYTPSHDTKQMAIKAARAIGAELCAVDILEGREPMVIEINLSPGVQGIMKATGINVPKKIAEFLARRTKEHKEHMTHADYKKAIRNIGVSTTKNDAQELIAPLTIKAGIIKLPSVVTDIAKFATEDDVRILVSKGRVEIQKYPITKEEKE